MKPVHRSDLATVRAHRDHSLSAVVTSCLPLHYADKHTPSYSDRPPHARGASALVATSAGLVVVQDDTLFLGIIDPSTQAVRSVALPADVEGVRVFDDIRGNKADKLDLESALWIRDRLLLFGSGSTPARERVMQIRRLDSDSPEVAVVSASPLYEQMRREERCAGSELNLEGVAHTGGVVRFFQRGNGAPRGARKPIDATCDVNLDAILDYLDGSGPLPRLEAIRQYDLGHLDGVRLTFTDASTQGDRMLFLATAEASPDAVRDGPVVGTVLGIIDSDNRARWAPLCGGEGELLRIKAEGLAFPLDSRKRAYIATDADDPMQPSQLCEVELRGY